MTWHVNWKWTSFVLAVALGAPLLGQANNRPTRPKVQRPEGAAWDALRKNCINCHGIDDYAYYAQDRAAWKKLIASKHPPGEAVLAEKDEAVVLDWLAAKFGPGTKPFPRTYVPPEITTFFSDPEAKRMLNRACTRCHGVERVEGLRKDAEGWRVLLVDMRERGAVLADEELERLVEWLDRVWGTNRDK